MEKFKNAFAGALDYSRELPAAPLSGQQVGQPEGWEVVAAKE